MQQVFLQQNHSSKLNLIFLGYGQDVAHFEYLKDKTDNDIALVFDYQNHNFDASVYTEYQEINLITWPSFVISFNCTGASIIFCFTVRLANRLKC